MINRENRFKGRRDPRIVLKHGKTIRGNGVQLKYLHNQNSEQPRIAVTVSTKVTKLAPKRNRIRRRIYEIVRTNLDKVPNSTDLVISVFDKNFATDKHSEVEEKILKLIKQIPNKN